MARSIDTIQAQIIAQAQADSNLSGLTSTSKRAIWRLWTYVTAVCINVFEQLQDLYYAKTEALIAAAPSGNAQWIQATVFKFQYSSTTPQVLQLNTSTLAYEYPTVDSTLRIITRCSVTADLLNNVRVKVAKGSTPAALSSPELSALQSYMNTVGFAGINYICTSTNSDKLFIAADVYYQGQYSAVIAATLKDAVDAFLAAIPFNGIVKLTDLEGVMRNVVGVNDVVMKDVAARADATLFASKTYLVQNNTELQRQWQTLSGYIVTETTSSNTFADTINLIAQ